MKRNILLFIAVVSALLLSVSCDRKYEYQEHTYATLYRTSYSVAEDVEQLKVPVLLNNASGSEVQVSVKLTAGSAEEGTDYELISPASGVLTFSGDTDSLDVVISITSFKGEFTGGKDFTLEISSLTEGVLNGKHTLAKVAIADLDHPLNAFIGSWSGNTTEEFSGASITMMFDIAADPDDFTKLVITTQDNVLGVPVELTADAELNEDGTGVIVIPTGQPLGYDLNVGPGVYNGVNTPTFSAATSYSDIVMNLNSDGTMTVPNGYGVFDDQYIYGCYVGGYTLTKE